jgi:hypothetical protein
LAGLRFNFDELNKPHVSSMIEGYICDIYHRNALHLLVGYIGKRIESEVEKGRRGEKN